MTQLAFTVLEIIAISVPLIAIILIQILRTEPLQSALTEDILSMIAKLLLFTGIVLLFSVLAAAEWAINSMTSLFGVLSVSLLSLGLGTLIITVLIFPMVVLSGEFDDIRQTSLDEAADQVTDREQDLGSEGSEGEVETELETE